MTQNSIIYPRVSTSTPIKISSIAMLPATELHITFFFPYLLRKNKKKECFFQDMFLTRLFPGNKIRRTSFFSRSMSDLEKPGPISFVSFVWDRKVAVGFYSVVFSVAVGVLLTQEKKTIKDFSFYRCTMVLNKSLKDKQYCIPKYYNQSVAF